MSKPTLQIELRTAPHVHAPRSVENIMLNVVLALLPICFFSVWQYGLSSAVLIFTVTATCLATERFFSSKSGKGNTLGDWSATITGLLLALTLPPSFPLWMGVVAGFASIALGKALFGGLGFNPFNPALIGRAFVQAAFPSTIASFIPAFAQQRFVEFAPSTLTAPMMIPADNAGWIKAAAIDAFTGATPLGRWKFENFTYSAHDFLSGSVTAAAGETSAILILLCGAYLALRKFMDWRIPVAVLGSAALLAWALHLAVPARYPDPAFVLLSGGLMLGAVFMATDMATSPVTPLGVWIYGALIGVLTVVIRYFGGLTEGVMYAILIANAAAPLIEQFTQPRTYGATKKVAEK
ncbi:MAG TPA: RnfABCDGE type electron transport complex subunit D [Novimethylophilus sp.]|jgi:electron transport complex protein RnfD|uniref:RnfABCDGE type electron transport complex subunit D n=1 Tax=Novimethylophilus sp. TaxID=2137426 RepID=UPI002F41C8FC